MERPARTLLEQLIREQDATYEEQAAAFEALSRQLGEPATLSTRHLQRLAAGQRSGEKATPSLRRVIRQLYGHPLDELVAPPPTSRAVEPARDGNGDARKLTAAAAQGSLEFAAWADADQLSPSVVEHVSYELGRIAVDYVSTPVLPLLEDLIAVRDTMFGLLRDRPNPRQSRELFFLAGTTCLLMAHATQNVGDSASAMAQARTAWACAEQADHHGLRAWTRGTQALIAEWSRRPTDALTFLDAGAPYATTPEAQVRLAAIEARTRARLGQADAARDAVARLRVAQQLGDGEPDELTTFGGLLTFPAAKQLYYLGSTYALVGDHDHAEAAALEAITRYETGLPEQRSYGDEALARVDVALARLASGDVDGAADALALVLDLPADQRIRQLRTGIARVRSILLTPRFGSGGLAAELAGRIAEFSA